MPKGRGRDKKRRKKRKGNFNISYEDKRALSEKKVAIVSGLVGTTLVAGAGVGLTNEKFRRVFGSGISKASESVGRGLGFVGAANKYGRKQGEALFVENEVVMKANELKNKGAAKVAKSFGGYSTTDPNSIVAKTIDRAKSDTKVVVEAAQTRVQKDVAKRKKFTEDFKTWAENTDYAIRGRRKEKSTLGYSRNREEFWLEFSSRRERAIEFASASKQPKSATSKRRKRKPHSEATKNKISNSLKKNRSSAQEFKDYTSGVSNILGTGARLSRAYDLKRVTNQDLTSRENRRRFSAAAPVLSSGVRAVFGNQGVFNKNSGIYSDAVRRNSLSRMTMVELERQKFIKKYG
jgi:hypothetical protein